MKWIVTLAAILLLGCGQATVSEDNYGYGWHYDVQSGSGLRVRYNGVNPQIDIIYIESLYVDVVNCVGTPAHGNPLLVFVDSSELGNNGNYSPGLIYRDTGLILIDKDTATDYWNWFRSTAGHEFTHWLLNGVISDEEHRLHTSPIFSLCAVS